MGRGVLQSSLVLAGMVAIIATLGTLLWNFHSDDQLRQAAKECKRGHPMSDPRFPEANEKWPFSDECKATLIEANARRINYH